MNIFYHSLVLMLPLLLPISMLAGCKNPAPAENKSAQKNSPASIPSRAVLRLNTPEKQLSYANSAINDAEKRTALQAIQVLFPSSRFYTGLAALELAYMQLGPDYRLATQQQCRLALEQYTSISENFSDIPDISTKALWYLGWITTELLHDREQGVQYYEKITASPNSSRLESQEPVPWLSVKPEQKMQSHDSYLKESNLTWADLAHLEIIRNAPDKEAALSSLRSLHAGEPLALITRLGLKAALQRHDVKLETEFMLEQYLMNVENDALIREDIMALKEYTPHREPGHHDQE